MVKQQRRLISFIPLPATCNITMSSTPRVLMGTFRLGKVAWSINGISVLDVLNVLTQSLHTLVGIGTMHKILYLSQTSRCLMGVIPKSKSNKNYAGRILYGKWIQGLFFFSNHCWCLPRLRNTQTTNLVVQVVPMALYNANLPLREVRVSFLFFICSCRTRIISGTIKKKKEYFSRRCLQSVKCSQWEVDVSPNDQESWSIHTWT